MKNLPKQIQDTVNSSLAIIKQKKPERKVIIIGIILCAFILLLLSLVATDDTSMEERIFGKTPQTIYSPVDGTIVELSVAEGAIINRGDALLRFDPAHIRRQNSIIRDYLDFFKANRHNTGTLKQKFKPIFAEIFDELAMQRKIFSEKEQRAIKLYREASLAHSKLKLQMRNPNNKGKDGLPLEDFVKKEKQASLDIEQMGVNLERASLERADIDRQIRKVTKDLSQPYGMLYLYLEEEFAKVQDLLRNEYLYAPSYAKMGKTLVKVGDHVKKGDPIYEIFPKKYAQ